MRFLSCVAVALGLFSGCSPQGRGSSPAEVDTGGQGGGTQQGGQGGDEGVAGRGKGGMGGTALNDAGAAGAAGGSAVAALPAGPKIFVATSGSDSGGDGSATKPFATIGAAAAAAKPGDTVVIRAGTYRETVTPRLSGEAANPITFMPYPNEMVTVSGADPVTGFTKDANNAYVATANFTFTSTTNQSDQVFWQGAMIHLGRYPDYGADIARPKKASLTKFIRKSRADNWTTGVFEDANLPVKPDGFFAGAGIYMQPDFQAWSWTFTGTVTDHKGKQLTLKSRNDSGNTSDGSSYPVGSRYYLFGKKELMDAPGEWYLDRAAKKLFIIPPDSKAPTDADVQMKRRELCFDLDGKSFITIRDLTLFACAISTDKAAGGDNVGYESDGKTRYPWRGGGSVAASQGVVISGITARYMDHITDLSGHFYLQWGQSTGIVLSGKGHRIENSRLGPSACNGITLLGQGHRATNNLIENVDYVSVDCAGINTGGAAPTSDHEIDHNTIRFTGRSCMTTRKLANSDLGNLKARVHHNDLHHCMLQDWDGGGLYTAVSDLKWQRIDHNWVHDMDGFAVAGLYTDWCKNVIVDHNAIWNVEWGILHQGYFDDKANNALCYNNSIAVKNTSSTPYGPFGFGGNKGSNMGTVLRNNLVMLLNEGKGYKPVSDAYGSAQLSENMFSNGSSGPDLGFTNPAQGDFSFKVANAPGINAGKPVGSISRDGFDVPSFNDVASGAPDLGAYEHGQPAWTAGCSLAGCN
ncbi:MAG: hypothetical protein SF187_01610 [Deltaproteobacteria bacterium]|nr:hypothetical protein [Deltaproteobacteria bacterium]